MNQLPQFFLGGTTATSLPADDAYSDGFLETMRCQSGRVPLWPLHRARLLRSGRVAEAEIAGIEAFLPGIAAACPEDSAKVRLRWGFIGGRPQWDLSLLPLEPAPELQRGVRLFLCRTRLPALETANPGCKLLRRTGYNRASAELPAGEPCEGLLLDSEGRVIESLRCNLLARIGGAWVTPDLRRCGVRGVMRDWLGSRIPLREMDMDLDALCAAEEVALCNSLRGVMPVRELIGRRTWPIGPETRRLQQLTALLW